MGKLPYDGDGAVAFGAQHAFGWAEEYEWGRLVLDAFLQAGKEEDRVAAFPELQEVLPRGTVLRGGGLALPVQLRATNWVIAILGRGRKILLRFPKCHQMRVALVAFRVKHADTGRSPAVSEFVTSR